MRKAITAALLTMAPSLVCCSYAQTRMEPVDHFAAAARPSVTAVPAHTAGPSYTRTTSPDGATTFVCLDGSARPASEVPAGSRPAC